MNIHQKTTVDAIFFKAVIYRCKKTMKRLNIFTQMLKTFELTLISANQLDAKQRKYTNL